MWKANIEGIDQIIIDPGIGFGKTVVHNLRLIKNVHELKNLIVRSCSVSPEKASSEK